MIRQKVRGAVRMKQLGQKAIQLWLTPDQFEKLTAASKKERRTRTDMVRCLVLDFLKSR